MSGAVVTAHIAHEKINPRIRSEAANVETIATAATRLRSHVKGCRTAEEKNQKEKSETGTAEMGATTATHM